MVQRLCTVVGQGQVSDSCKGVRYLGNLGIEPLLLPDAEAGKNLAQQIIAGESPCDAGQAVMRQQKFFRSEESRVGKECVRTCIYRGSRYHKKKKNTRSLTNSH